MDIYHADILRFDTDNLTFPEDLARRWDDDCPNLHIIGNLPFNISTPLIIKWLSNISERKGLWKYGRTPLILTFQKEVADRMVAPMVGDHRCRLSLICQYLCDVKVLFNIPGKAFVPSPKVDVSVVKFEPLKRPLINEVPFSVVSKVLQHVFHYRRKKITRGIRWVTFDCFNDNVHDVVHHLLYRPVK